MSLISFTAKFPHAVVGNQQGLKGGVGISPWEAEHQAGTIAEPTREAWNSWALEPIADAVADVADAVAEAQAVVDAGAGTLAARDAAALSAAAAQQAVITAPFAGLAPAPAGVIATLVGSDGAVIASYEYDRPTGSIRLKGHTLASDVASSLGSAVAAQVNAALAPASAGVFAELVAPDGRVIGRLNWNRALQTAQWDGHAMNADLVAGLSAATADQTTATEIPARAGVVVQFVSSDDRVLASGLWDRTASVVRWDHHVLDTDPVALADRQVTEAKLDLGLARVTVPHGGDTVPVEPASLRSVAGQPTAKTSITGYGWTRFLSDQSPHIIGVNDTGTTLQFRRSWGLNIVGQSYVGTFDPGAVASLVDRGAFTTTLPDPAGYADGDFLEATVGAGVTIGSDTYAQGDLAVKSGGAWVKQACPAGAANEAEFWQASAAGTFKGQAYAAADRIVHLTTRSVSNVGRRLWMRGRPDLGQVFLRGETATPATAAPASPVDGDLWQVTAANGSYAVDDYLLRQDGAWLRLATDGIASYADGATIARRCERGAQDWEFRRADKSATRVGLALRSRIERKMSRPTSADLFFIGDSMPGFLVSSLTAALAGTRAITTESYGGHTASQLRGIFRDLVFNRADPFGGRIVITWHGQNNVGDADQTNETNAEIVALMGARDRRAILMSVLGQYIATFNGSRIVVANHEGQFARNVAGNVMFRTVYFLEQQFPDFVFDTRKELCIDAPSTPALLWPGMTEAEVATTYGIVPFSYFFNYSAVSWTPGSLAFTGYRSAAGLPTGGANLDYQIRTVADAGLDHPIGTLYVRQAGVWTAHQIPDVTHITVPLGNQRLAARIVNRLTERGW